MDIYNLVSLLGVFVLILVAFLFSTDKKSVNWKLVACGIGLQILIAFFIFIIPVGTKIFLFLNDVVLKVISSAFAGAEFLFGRLALGPGQMNAAGEKSIGFILAFQALPTIIFFSALMAVLYFLNIITWVIRGFAYFFTRFLKISGAESLVAVSNIFVGVESAFVVKPYLNKMTRSELCTVLTAGMATVASNVLVVYVFTLKSQFPSIAGHLISASLLSVPAAIVMSKVLMPEKEKPETLGLHVKPHYEKDASLFEAIINGANSGVKLIVGIAALLVAVLGLVSLFDMCLGLVCPLSLKDILGYIFYPFTIILGIPLADAGIISKIIGEKLIVTEVVAYKDLAIVMSENLLKHPRSAVIATYALCGFTHVASMAIFVGGFSALAPKRMHAISGVAVRALFAATLTCLMTACIAGAFFTKGSILLGG